MPGPGGIEINWGRIAAALIDAQREGFDALALSGGGARGDFQAGACSYLLTANTGVRPKVIAGCSVGALNGALLAHGPGSAKRLLGVWGGLRRNEDMYVYSKPVQDVIDELRLEGISERTLDEALGELADRAAALLAEFLFVGHLDQADLRHRLLRCRYRARAVIRRSELPRARPAVGPARSCPTRRLATSSSRRRAGAPR